MKWFTKAFLFVVGVVTLTYDEVAKSIEEATKSLEQNRKKIAETTK